MYDEEGLKIINLIYSKHLNTYIIAQMMRFIILLIWLLTLSNSLSKKVVLYLINYELIKLILLKFPLPLPIKMFMIRISCCEKSHHGTNMKWEGWWLISVTLGSRSHCFQSPLAVVLIAFPASSMTNDVHWLDWTIKRLPCPLTSPSRQ